MKYLLCIILLFNCSISTAEDLYTWEDKNGYHIVDDLGKVPAKYRKKYYKNESNSTYDNPYPYRKKDHIIPRKTNGKLDVSDLQSQLIDMFDKDVNNACRKILSLKLDLLNIDGIDKTFKSKKEYEYKSDFNSCVARIKIINMNHYLDILKLYKNELTKQELTAAVNWNL